MTMDLNRLAEALYADEGYTQPWGELGDRQKQWKAKAERVAQHMATCLRHIANDVLCCVHCGEPMTAANADQFLTQWDRDESAAREL